MTALLLASLKRTMMLTALASLVISGHSSGVMLSETQTSSQSSQTKQPATKQAVLLIDTDDSCRLFVDGEDKGIVTPEQSQKFKVALGIQAVAPMVGIHSLLVFLGDFETHARGLELPFQTELGDFSLVVKSSDLDMLWR